MREKELQISDIPGDYLSKEDFYKIAHISKRTALWLIETELISAEKPERQGLGYRIPKAYESIFRARDVFAADKIIIVTQEYHLYRALHIANALDVEAYGVAADYHTYVGQAYRELREILARNKDFVTSIFKPDPTYLGDVIPVSGDGNLTNDEDMEPLLS